MNNVYFSDIVSRHNLSNDEDIGELVEILSSGISTLVNPIKLANTFKTVKGSQISKTTIAHYINYLEDAFIVSCVKRYDVKGKNTLICHLKYILKILVYEMSKSILDKSNQRILWRILFIIN